MYFFLNRYQKLKGEKADYCKGIFGKLNEENQQRLIKKGNVTAIVMGIIYAVVLALMVACAVVSFICKYWWAGVFFCVFAVLIAYLTYSGFSWRKREGYEYAKLFGEEIIYMLGRQERDKLTATETVETVLEKVVEENKQEKKSIKKTTKKEQPKQEPVEESQEEVAQPKKKAGRPAKAEKTEKKAGRPAKTEKTEKATKKATKSTTKKSSSKASTTVAKRGRPRKTTK